MDILLNWLWRGCIVAAAAHALVWSLGPLAPRTRYRVWWAAMLLTLLLPLLPALNELWMPEVATPALVGRLSPLVSLPDGTARVNIVLLALWGFWIAGIGARTLRSAAATRHARRRARGFDPRIERHLMRWSTMHGRGRLTRLAISDDVRLAAVLGVGSPVIALSPTVIGALSLDDLDRVVVHEWAHVQRRDDVANALQLVVRILIGWHPAAWWIGRQIDLERELACDEQACALTGGVKQYASCLATLASLTARRETLPVPSALISSQVTRRVSRILALPRVNTGRWARGAATISTGALCLLASSIASVDLVGVYAADVVAALHGRSFMLPMLRTRDVAANRPSILTGESDVESPLVPIRAAAKAAAAQRNAPTPAASTPAGDAGTATSAPTAAAPTAPAATLAAEAITSPASALVVTPAPAAPAPAPPATTSDSSLRPWTMAADAGVAVGAGSQKAGVAVGAGSQKAAVATAGFFTRFGKAVARSF